MKFCFVSIDIESDFAKGKGFLGVENIEKILKLLEGFGIPATLFVTGNVLEKYRNKFKNLSGSYEIACHSFSHRYWNELGRDKRQEELRKFILLYKEIFENAPSGFRAPSHVIDEDGLKLLEENKFLYDSSVVPNYPFFKTYRGFKGRAVSEPYQPSNLDYRKAGGMNILEIPVSGLMLGVPVAGTWIRKLPFFVYQYLLLPNTPKFLAVSLHSWDSLSQKTLEKAAKLLKILKDKNFEFLNGLQVYEKFSKNRQ